MPPVRWKLSAVTIMCLLQMVYAESPFRQEGMSMDGWKPIVGVGTRQPHFYDSPQNQGNRDSFGSHSTPSPGTGPTVSTGPSRSQFYRGSPKPPFMGGRKIPHQKYSHPDPFFALQARDNHGPHIPLNAVIQSRPGQAGQIKQLATTSRPMILLSTTMKRKRKTSMRVQSSTGGYRDEVFTASASSNPYNHYRQGPIRTRETVDLGLPGSNHYSINQPHSHIEFSRFSLAPGTVYRQYSNSGPPPPPYIFSKHPQSNDIDYQGPNPNEEYNRNGLPPGHVYKSQEYSRGKPGHENVVLQAPPPFQYTQQKINEPPVHVQVTKEKLHEFHNNVPPNYHGQYIEYDFSNTKPPTEGPKSVYEVSEGVWQDSPSQLPSRSRPPSSDETIYQDPSASPSLRPGHTRNAPSQSSVYEDDVPAFLPTPYKPEKQGVEPTSPTQSEVSTIYTKLSKAQRNRAAATTPNPFSYNTKEVSTHFPIFGRPVFSDGHSSKEASNEIPTRYEALPPPTSDPSRRPQRRRKPDPQRTTTTTTADSTHLDEQVTSPHRTRPTASSKDESVAKTRGRNRYRQEPPEEINYEPTRKRQKITSTSVPDNHKSEEEFYESSRGAAEHDEAASETSEEVEASPNVELELPGRHYVAHYSKENNQDAIKPFIVLTTTQKSTTNLDLPDYEVTSVANFADSVTTTVPPTTTTATHRVKIRPVSKFDNSNRPRFSVKDYKQKLSSQGTTTTPKPHKSTEGRKVRLPHRKRLSTTPASTDDEDTETKSKFVPKDARHKDPTESSDTGIITMKNVKSVNTRLRPFGRYKSTPATTTAPKVSIKSNLFSRKRPAMLSLRNKIFNKYHKNNTESATEKATTTEENDEQEVTEEPEIEVESSTESRLHTKATEMSLDVDGPPEDEIARDDPFFYSQMVSDLTSSTKNDYNTFKSVSPTSRRIPNYFTMTTDDPVLPIEAFFSSIKDSGREKDS